MCGSNLLLLLLLDLIEVLDRLLNHDSLLFHVGDAILPIQECSMLGATTRSLKEEVYSLYIKLWFTGYHLPGIQPSSERVCRRAKFSVVLGLHSFGPFGYRGGAWGVLPTSASFICFPTLYRAEYMHCLSCTSFDLHLQSTRSTCGRRFPVSVYSWYWWQAEVHQWRRS